MLFGLTACPMDCDEPVGPPAFPTLTVFARPTEQRVAQGASTLFTLDVSRANFTGPVALSVPAGGVPPGVTVDFDPQTVPPGTTQSVARVTVSPTAPVQYVADPPLTEIPIQATGPDGLRSASSLKVRLVPSSLAGITLNVTPASFNMLFNESREALVTIARQGNYSGPVAVAPTVAEKAGVATTVTPVTGVPDTWRLRISVANPELLLTALAFVQGSIALSFEIRATPQGLAPVNANVQAQIVLPSFNPSPARTPLTIAAGSQDTVSIVLRRSSGFLAPIPFTVDSAPAGITATVSPNPAVDDATRLTLRVASSVAPGEYVVVLRGTPSTESGATERKVRVHVIVTAAAPPPAYTLNAPNVSVVAGNTATATFGLTRSGGFTGAVNVSFAPASVGALPAGMTVVLDPNRIEQSSSTLRVGTTTATPPGVYAITATGTAVGLSNVVSTFNVTVIAPPRATTIAVAKLVNGTPQLTTAETVAIGSGVTLIPVVLDQNQQPIVGAPVTWTSSNTAVATVSSGGTVAAFAAGITNVTVRSVDNPNIQAAVVISVPAPPPVSNVARIELEPKNAEITSPATQQYRVSFFDAAGARISVESGGVLEFASSNLVASNPQVASITASTGLATGVTAGITTITARYLRNGVLVRSDETPLTVYAANTPGHYGSATISTNNNNTRTLRPGETLLFQIIVRNAAGTQITSGVTPAPTATSSSGTVSITPCTPGVAVCPSGVPGYFFTMTAASNAPVGSTVRIRYDVMGAGGEITMTISP